MDIIRVSGLEQTTGITTGSLFLTSYGDGESKVSKKITKKDLFNELATTGSNTFYGDQTISGSLNITGSLYLLGLNSGSINDQLLTINPTTKIIHSITGLTASQIPAKYYGSFYDTTNQTGVAGAVLTMGLNNSDSWNNGVSIVSGDRITIANPGVYNLMFSAQMVKTAGNSTTHTHIWLSQNGVDVPVSASQLGFPSNSVYVVAAWNFFFKTTSDNEYVQLKWSINSNADNAVSMASASASGNIPAIPGLIVTVNQVG